MTKHVYAYTQTVCRSFPGYVNLSEFDNGNPVLTVRSPEESGIKSGSCVVPVEQLLALADAIYARYAADKLLDLPKIAGEHPPILSPQKAG